MIFPDVSKIKVLGFVLAKQKTLLCQNQAISNGEKIAYFPSFR